VRGAPDPERDAQERDDAGTGAGDASKARSRDEDVVPALLASARHELRSPLQSIQGFAELLDSEAYGSLTPEQHTFVEHIVQSSLELGRVIDGCIELAERELAHDEAPGTRVHVRAALAEALEQVRSSTQVDVTAHFDDCSFGVRAKLDAASVRRALSALCGAIAGTQKTLEATLGLDDDGYVALRFARPGATSQAPLLTVPQLIERRATARALLWLRLAQLLLAAQDATLRVSEGCDRAEVRFRPSSQH